MSDFVRHLERTFRTAYGQEPTSAETKDMLLPTNEGTSCVRRQELPVVAKNEERPLADLRRRQEYSRSNSQSSQFSSLKPKNSSQHGSKPVQSQPGGNSQPDQQPAPESKTGKATERKCCYCKKPGHLMHQCPLRK